MYALLSSLVALCIAGLPITFARAQEPPVVVWKSKDGWNVFLYRDNAGYFDRCSTVIEYSSGRLMAFSVGLNSELVMRIAHRAKPIGQPGQHLQIYLRIDDMAPRTAPAVVEKRENGNVSAVTNFRNDYAIFRNLRRGHALELSGDLGQEAISLKGSAKALRKMAECVPRPFTSALREYQVKIATGAIVSVKLPDEFGPESENKDMTTLHDALLGEVE